MTITVSFIVQMQNETDGDRCRYALATLDVGVLIKAEKAFNSLAETQEGLEAIILSSGIAELHVVDASFPVGECEVPAGCSHPLSASEQAAFDAEGWAVVPATTVSAVPTDFSGFKEEVCDQRIAISELGLQVLASWALDNGEALVRSWTVPWDVLETVTAAA